MIKASHLRSHIVIPTLAYLAETTGRKGLMTDGVVELIMGTIAHESLGGYYLRQHPTGPARGIGQMEKETHDSLWEHQLKFRADLADAVRSLASPRSFKDEVPDSQEVIGNLNYAVAMIRVRYLPAPEPIPASNDLPGLANYHVRYYNRGGAASVIGFIRDYRKYVKGEKV